MDTTAVLSAAMAALMVETVRVAKVDVRLLAALSIGRVPLPRADNEPPLSADQVVALLVAGLLFVKVRTPSAAPMVVLLRDVKISHCKMATVTIVWQQLVSAVPARLVAEALMPVTTLVQ